MKHTDGMENKDILEKLNKTRGQLYSSLLRHQRRIDYKDCLQISGEAIVSNSNSLPPILAGPVQSASSSSKVGMFNSGRSVLITDEIRVQALEDFKTRTVNREELGKISGIYPYDVMRMLMTNGKFNQLPDPDKDIIIFAKPLLRPYADIHGRVDEKHLMSLLGADLLNTKITDYDTKPMNQQRAMVLSTASSIQLRQ